MIADQEQAFRDALRACPVIAILRNLAFEKALAVGEALIASGVRLIEFPLNGDDALKRLKLFAETFKERAVVGAGTVLSPEDLDSAAEAGARFILSPDMNSEIVRAVRNRGLASVPGVATPTEAFAALRCGATALKAFPGEMLPPSILKAWRTVLPKDTLIIASGGVGTHNVQAYLAAGANGFGVASAFFNPAWEPEEVRAKAEAFVRACS